jgi:hypothetical protein
MFKGQKVSEGCAFGAGYAEKQGGFYCPPLSVFCFLICTAHSGGVKKVCVCLRLWLDKIYRFHIDDFKGFFCLPKFQAISGALMAARFIGGFPCHSPQSYPQTLGVI